MFETVVVALDGSATSKLALGEATRLARENGSSIHAVHVVEITAARGGGPVGVDAREVRTEIEQRVKALADSGVTISLQVYEAMAGSPAQLIADVAQKVGADLVVTGTRGHGSIAGVFLGSVAQRLLSLVSCPVLVVPKSVKV